MTDTTERGANELCEPEEANNLENMFHPRNICSETDDESDRDLKEENLSPQSLGSGPQALRYLTTHY